MKKWVFMCVSWNICADDSAGTCNLVMATSPVDYLGTDLSPDRRMEKELLDGKYLIIKHKKPFPERKNKKTHPKTETRH
jgi:hypothetical protein